MFQIIFTRKDNGALWKENWGTPEGQTKLRIKRRDMDGGGALFSDKLRVYIALRVTKVSSFKIDERGRCGTGIQLVSCFVD